MVPATTLGPLKTRMTSLFLVSAHLGFPEKGL